MSPDFPTASVVRRTATPAAVEKSVPSLKHRNQDTPGHLYQIPLPLYSAPVTRRIRKLIDHPTFERLRLLPQLLLVRAVHPGGVHSHFEHALGCYALGRRYLIQLLAQPAFRVLFGPRELEEALLVILLSNVDAFPLHHIMHELHPKSAWRGILAKDKDIVDWFLEWRAGPNQPSLLELIGDNFPHVDIPLITRVLRGDSPSKEHEKVLHMLIHSSLDVRVVDYILRDAHHTGANTGTNMDLASIIGNLVYLPNTLRLGITRAGVHPVENLLCARYWMYTRVYWGPINRSLASMLRYTLYVLMEKAAVKKETLFHELQPLDEFGVLRKLTDLWQKHVTNEYRDYSLLEKLTQPRPKAYPLLLELSAQVRGVPAGLIEAFRNKSAMRLAESREEVIQDMRDRGWQLLRPHDLLLDIPRVGQPKAGEDVSVVLSDRLNDVEELRNSSSIVSALPGSFSRNAFKLRVYISHERSDQLRRDGAYDDFQNQVRDIIYKMH